MKKLSLLFVLSFALLAQADQDPVQKFVQDKGAADTALEQARSEDQSWRATIKKSAVWNLSRASALAIGVGAGSAACYLGDKYDLLHRGGDFAGVPVMAPMMIIGGVAIYAVGELSGYSEYDMVDLYGIGFAGFISSPIVFILRGLKNEAPERKPLTGVPHEGFQDPTVESANPGVDNNIF